MAKGEINVIARKTVNKTNKKSSSKSHIFNSLSSPVIHVENVENLDGKVANGVLSG